MPRRLANSRKSADFDEQPPCFSRNGVKKHRDGDNVTKIRVHDGYAQYEVSNEIVPLGVLRSRQCMVSPAGGSTRRHPDVVPLDR